MAERTREELLGAIGEQEDTIEVLKKSIIRLNAEVEQLKKDRQELVNKIAKQKYLMDKMTELYVETAWKLRRYEEYEKKKRLNHDSK